MLSYLHVKNFALIKEVEIDFEKGLTVLTGETGAGKSIIIGSMNALSGGKLDKGIIRQGAEYALIEMIFEVDKAYADYLNTTYDVPFDEEHSLVVSRRFNASGRSVYRVNSETATSGLVKEISEHMIDIHSQHDHQSLLKQGHHIVLLDRYIGDEISVLKERLGGLYNSYRDHMKKISEDALDDEKRRREMDFLRFEIDEIESAELNVGEDERLHKEYKVLSNRQKIVKNLSEASYMLENNPEGSITQMLGIILADIGTVSQYDVALEGIAQEAEQVDGLVRDLYRSIEQYLNGIEMDHQDLDAIEARLHLINTLKSKYGENVEDILKLLEEKRESLEYFEHYDENIERIKEEIQRQEQEILRLCGDISAMRQTAAGHISLEIQKILAELNFADSKVAVEVVQKDRFDASGYDSVTILISTNRNEKVQPLNKIASGGELSRVMLALKSVFADMDKVGTLVFDEIDTGISGRTAQKVAEKMAALSASRQLICITHLPQIAAMADDHMLIEKSEAGDRIETSVHLLRDALVHEELARLIGGATITDNTLQSAKEMKEQADMLKKV